MSRKSRAQGLWLVTVLFSALGLFGWHIITFAQVAAPSAQTSTQEKSQRLAAKEALLEGIKSVDRGFSATEEQRSMIREKIDELVRWNPSREPAKKLGGEWTLIYTNAPDILNIPTTPFSSIGRIGQEIDSTKGIILNVIEYRPSSLASGLKEAATEDALVQRVYTEYTVSSENSVELQIRGLGVDPQRVFGFEVPEALKLKVQGPLSLPFGNFEVLYLDEEIRIIRTGQGWYSVNRRGVFG